MNDTAHRVRKNTLSLRSLGAGALVLSIAASAIADEVLLTGVDGRSPGLAMKDVTVVRVDGDNIVIRSAGGEDRKQPLNRIFSIKPTGDLAFADAEDAYINKQYDKAIDGYQKVARAADGWKVMWVVPRLIDAANKTKRFDAALAGYISMARVDANVASTIKPALPPKGSKFLDDADRDLSTAVRAAMKDPERQALLSLLLDVQLARGDQPGAETTVDQLLKLAGGNGAEDPKLAGLVAEIRLGQARVALEAKRYDEVTKAIDAAAPRLVEPKQQAEALFLRAEAQLAQAKPGDKPAYLDAAIAYMRVVAHFGDADGTPFVGQSLLGASGALESAGDIAAARSLCEQIIAEMPQTPYAAEATQRVARMAAGK